MDIRQLKYFRAIADHGSLTAAAAALNVTQPALGIQLRRLEEGLNVRLVERHSRGVTLTEAGTLLNVRAIEILERLNRTEQELSRFSDTPSGTVRIGVTPSLGRVLVPSLLERCADRFPEINLLFSQGFSDQLDVELAQRVIDFAHTHTNLENERIESIPLYIEPLFLIGVPEMIPSGTEPVELESLSDFPLALDERSQEMRRVLDGEIAKSGKSFENVAEIQSINIRRELVVQGRRGSIAPFALFATEIESGLLVAREVSLKADDRTVHLTGPRVEKMTSAESAVRTMIIELVDKSISKNQFGWRMPQS